MIIDERTYQEIYDDLNRYEDIDRLASKYNYYDRELFLVIFTQKQIRDVTSKFHKVKNKADKLTKEWRSGKSFLKIAEEIDYPPVMAAYIIVTNMEYGKKSFRKMLNHPEKIKNQRMRKEIEKVRIKDPIYSPEGYEVQRKRGEWGEERLRVWLDENGVEYEREEDLRSLGGKTPDFLLKEPVYFRGEKIVWIESKASFGDQREVRKNLSKQLESYLEIFGPGMVIYWFGILDSLPVIEGIVIETEEVLRDHWDF
ncbi:MAG: TPD domain-containing protein [Thermoplasmatota archaeon]